MSDRAENGFDEFVNEAPKRGFFSSSEAPRLLWQCPFCDHSLSYKESTRDAAELAANSHLSRQHKAENAIILLHDAPRPEGR